MINKVPKIKNPNGGLINKIIGNKNNNQYILVFIKFNNNVMKNK